VIEDICSSASKFVPLGTTTVCSRLLERPTGSSRWLTYTCKLVRSASYQSTQLLIKDPARITDTRVVIGIKFLQRDDYESTQDV
jgi:hypothetical protein